MKEALLDAIPDEGVSYSRLYDFFPNWQDSTFNALLESLISAGDVTRTAGGGSGVIRRVNDDTRKLESERAFLAALAELANVKDANPKGVPSEAVREFLEWDKDRFDAVRKTLKDRGDIEVRPGPGALLTLRAPKSERAAAPAAQPKASAKTPAKAVIPDVPSVSTAKKIAATVAETAIDASRDREDLLTTLRDLLQNSGRVTNQQLRNHFDWTEPRYWHARTLLHDAGNIAFERGSAGLVHIQRRASLLPIGGLDLALQRKLFLALPPDGSPVTLISVAEKFSETREKLTEAGTRLQGAGLARFSYEAEEIALSPEVLADRSDDTDEIEILDRFTALGSLGSMISEHVLKTELGWKDHQFQQAMARLEARSPAVITRNKAVGIVSLVPVAGPVAPVPRERQTPNPCRSPMEFSRLVDSLQTRKVIAFVGAGSSADTGVPGWSQLVEQMLTASTSIEERTRAEIGRYVEQKRFIPALSALQDALDEHPFADAVRAALGPANQAKPCTPLVTSLTFLADRLESVFTTNLDAILEGAFGWNVELDLSPGTDIRKKVVKLHGTLDKPETWVLTRPQYSRKYLGNAAYRDRFKAIYNDATLMFIGYGMQDVELDAILEWIEGVYQTHQQPRHFFFAHEDDESYSPYFYRRLQSLGLRPVLYRSPPQERDTSKSLNRHGYLPVLVAQLALHAQRRPPRA